MVQIELKNIDYSKLNQQKFTLLHLIERSEEKVVRDDLEGVVNLIDAIQDYAVDVLGVSEREVFAIKEEKFPRKCSVTGKGMSSGWVVGDGDLYFSESDFAENWAKENGTTLDQAHEDELIYYTEWEVDEDDEWYDKDGNLYTKCHKCGEGTTENEGVYFCTNCLRHL